VTPHPLKLRIVICDSLLIVSLMIFGSESSSLYRSFNSTVWCGCIVCLFDTVL